MKIFWKAYLLNVGFILAGFYLFSQKDMHEMLLGLGFMLFGSISWDIDSLAAVFAQEVIEIDLKNRFDALEAKLQAK